MKISPSQLATYRDCPRKWGWDKLEGIRSKPHPSAVLGTAVHAELEAWLEKGKAPDESTRAGRIATNAIPHLPVPGAGQVETKFELKVPEGFSFNGVVDLLYEDAAANIPVVHDHKTTAKLGYRKTPEQLRSDPQAIVYAAYVFSEHPIYDMLRCDWLYIETGDSGKVKVESITWTRPELEEAYEKLIPEAQELVQLRTRKARALELPYNPDSCEKYGGCFYKPNCNLTDGEKMRAQMTFGSLQQKVGQNDTPAQTNGAAPKLTGMAKLRAQLAQAAPAAAQPEPQPTVHPALAQAVAAQMAATSRGQINAPEAPDPEVEEEASVQAAAAAPSLNDGTPRRGRGRPPKNPNSLRAREEGENGIAHLAENGFASSAKMEAELAAEAGYPVSAKTESKIVAALAAQRFDADIETLSLAELESKYAHRAAIAAHIDMLRLLIKAAG